MVWGPGPPQTENKNKPLHSYADGRALARGEYDIEASDSIVLRTAEEAEGEPMAES